MLSSATEAMTHGSLGFQQKSLILLVCPPCMNSSSGGPSAASSGVCKGQQKRSTKKLGFGQLSEATGKTKYRVTHSCLIPARLQFAISPKPSAFCRLRKTLILSRSLRSIRFERPPLYVLQKCAASSSCCVCRVKPRSCQRSPLLKHIR